MTQSTSTLKTNQTGSLRRILLVSYRHWRLLLARWYTSPPSPASTWMKSTPKRNCFLPLLLVKLSKKWCLSIFPRYWKHGWISIFVAVSNVREYNLKCACRLKIVPYFYKIMTGRTNGEDVSGLEAELKEKMAKLNEVRKHFRICNL